MTRNRIFMAVLVLVALGYLFKFISDVRVEEATAIQERKMLEEENAKLQEANDHLLKTNQDITEGANKTIAALERQKSDIKSTESAIDVLARLGGLRTVPVLVPNPTLLDSPSTSLSKEDAITLAQKLVTCKETEVGLSSCSEQNKNLTTVVKNQEQELNNKDQEIRSFKGGGFWRKAGKLGKCAIFAGGGAGVGSTLAGARGAALGAVLGTGVCQVNF